jgi:hypothetical protein
VEELRIREQCYKNFFYSDKSGATTLSITTLSIMTLGIMTLNITTLSIMTVSIIADILACLLDLSLVE